VNACSADEGLPVYALSIRVAARDTNKRFVEVSSRSARSVTMQ